MKKFLNLRLRRNCIYFFISVVIISIFFSGCKLSLGSNYVIDPEEKVDVLYCLRSADLTEHTKQLIPYKFEGIQYLDVICKRYDQIFRDHVELKFDADYRFIFSKRGLPEVLANAPIKIFDRDFTDPDQKLITELNEKVFLFDYKKEMGLKRLYIEYFIPSKEKQVVNYVDKKGKTHEDIKQEAREIGCVGFVFGYINTD